MTANLAAVYAVAEKMPSPEISQAFAAAADVLMSLVERTDWPGGCHAVSMRPSERGDWIVAIYDSAPAEARVALLAYERVERRVPVESGFYAFMTRVATEPEPTMTRPWFE